MPTGLGRRTALLSLTDATGATRDVIFIIVVRIVVQNDF